MKIAIIGAGIGGLGTALALRRVGVETTVYEQAPAIEAVGAGIGLWPGALKSLREIGVAPWFWELQVSPFRWAQTATPGGRSITGFDVSTMTGGLGYVVRRSDLHAALREPLDGDALITGKRLVTVRQDPGGVDLEFSDGSQLRADMVIGADGFGSVVRSAVLGAQNPRYSGDTAYRGLARLEVADPGMMTEVQGGGVRGAVHPLDPGHVYWWTARRTDPGGQESPEQRKDTLLRILHGWVGGLPEAVAATPPEAILKNDLFDRDPVDRWSLGRMTLLGDAAHPTTPNLGLGGCMAIEDALVLARAFDETGDHTAAFAQYESERHARTASVVRMSRLMGRFGSWRNPVAVAAWQAANVITPSRVAASALAKQVTYDPGPLRR